MMIFGCRTFKDACTLILSTAHFISMSLLALYGGKTWTQTSSNGVHGELL